MEFDEFKAAVRFLPKQEGRVLRREYISRLINTSTEHWRKHIGLPDDYPDDFCYSGYLWDCLKEPIVTDCESVKALGDGLGDVLVFWDLHSEGRVWTPGWRKFGKEEVLSLDFRLLMDNLQHLPEDIYICDGSLRWTLILTHEYVDDKRWCLRCGSIARRDRLYR